MPYMIFLKTIWSSQLQFSILCKLGGGATFHGMPCKVSKQSKRWIEYQQLRLNCDSEKIDEEWFFSSFVFLSLLPGIEVERGHRIG